MKVKVVVLKQLLNLGELGFNGVRTLGVGPEKGREELELVDGFLKVSRKGKVAILPLTEVAYILLDDNAPRS
jgi:hypothetical protein